MVLQSFAIVAWIDHVISFALLTFVMYLAIFCFKFYWNNKTRRIEWGRSYVLYAVISTWVIAFLIAGFTAFFQCDSHIDQKDQCIKIVCAVSNIFSAIITELLTRVRVVIPIIIILLILLSVRVGSSTVRRESMVKVEGADIHGDRELLLMCSLVFGIYEVRRTDKLAVFTFLCFDHNLPIPIFFSALNNGSSTTHSLLHLPTSLRLRMALWRPFLNHGNADRSPSNQQTNKRSHVSAVLLFWKAKECTAGKLCAHGKKVPREHRRA